MVTPVVVHATNSRTILEISLLAQLSWFSLKASETQIAFNTKGRSDLDHHRRGSSTANKACNSSKRRDDIGNRST